MPKYLTDVPPSEINTEYQALLKKGLSRASARAKICEISCISERRFYELRAAGQTPPKIKALLLAARITGTL